MPLPASLLVGRGVADVTGQPLGSPMLGYGKADQVADGIHDRLHARAFVLLDPASDRRVLLVVCELPMIFASVHGAVLGRLAAAHGSLYDSSNVQLTATHTHCGPGGYAHHLLYNLSGYRPATFAAIVDGIIEAVDRAHADLAPSTVTLAHGHLTDASTNRSRSSFDRNPAADRAWFPEGIDPQTTVLAIGRQGSTVGVVNWFATHGTSRTSHNTLITGDNKGYAAYLWERLVEGVDHRRGSPHFVAAFAQTNAGDMSPNLDLAPGSGPTGDEEANARIIGARQQAAAADLLDEAGRTVTGGIDHRMTWVDLGDFPVDAAFTGDGRPHRTARPSAGAAAFAGTEEGPGFTGFHQGRGVNPVWEALSERVAYRLSPRLRDAQQPKAIALPGSRLSSTYLPLVAERVPVQLLRIGPLHLVGIPGEVTIAAGLRLRRAVANVVGAAVADVLIAGYANGYFHYVTTPEEYDAQRYEGGSTLFGRWQLGALLQVCTELATAMRDGRPARAGPPAPVRRRRPPSSIRARRARPDPAPPRRPGTEAAGLVLGHPRPRYAPGERVVARFVGAHPDRTDHRGATLLEVQHRPDDPGPSAPWATIADDNDWSTTIRWSRAGRHGLTATVTWDVPGDSPAGTYRIVYLGDDPSTGPFASATSPFEVAAPATG